MARIVRSDAALADVLAIVEYIAADNATAAENWVAELDATLALLSQQPEIGEQVDYLAPGVRRHCLGNYLLFYKVISDGIELRRVLHGARRIEDLLK